MRKLYFDGIARSEAWHRFGSRLLYPVFGIVGSLALTRVGIIRQIPG